MTRDEIPADWVQLPGTLDRRVAAKVPVTFGDPAATLSLSEQPVCARGYGVLAVNDLLGVPVGDRLLAILLPGNPAIAPHGAEKFVWAPVQQRLRGCRGGPGRRALQRYALRNHAPSPLKRRG